MAVTFCRSLRGPCGSICDTTRVTPSPDGPTGGTRRLPAWPPGRSAGLWAGSADGVGPGTPGWETDGRSVWATALRGGQGACPCPHPLRPRGCDAGHLGAVWELRLRVGTGLCHCPRTLRGPASQEPSVQTPQPRAPGGGQYQHRRRWGSQTGLLEGQSHSVGQRASGTGVWPRPLPLQLPPDLLPPPPTRTRAAATLGAAALLSPAATPWCLSSGCAGPARVAHAHGMPPAPLQTPAPPGISLGPRVTGPQSPPAPHTQCPG